VIAFRPNRCVVVDRCQQLANMQKPTHVTSHKTIYILLAKCSLTSRKLYVNVPGTIAYSTIYCRRELLIRMRQNRLFYRKITLLELVMTRVIAHIRISSCVSQTELTNSLFTTNACMSNGGTSECHLWQITGVLKYQLKDSSSAANATAANSFRVNATFWLIGVLLSNL